MEPKYPDVTVQLSGCDGNVFGVIGKVSKAIRQKSPEQAATFTSKAMSSESYDDVLRLCMEYVNVE